MNLAVTASAPRTRYKRQNGRSLLTGAEAVVQLGAMAHTLRRWTREVEELRDQLAEQQEREERRFRGDED